MKELVDELPLQQAARSKQLTSANLWSFVHTKRVTCVCSFSENSSIRRCQSREVAFHSKILHSTRRCRQSKENVMVSWEHETGSERRRATVSARGPLDNVNNRNIQTFGAENDLPFGHLSQCVERLSNNRVMRLHHANYEVLERNNVFIALLFLAQLTPTPPHTTSPCKAHARIA